MPIGGENIGTAYVRVIADGKDFDIHSLFDETEGEAGKSGRRASKAYREAWVDEWESRPSQSKMDEAIRNVLVKGDTAKAITNSSEWQRFRQGFEKEFGEVGRRAADNLEKELRDGLDVSQLEGRLTGLRKDLIRAEKQLNTEAQRDAENEWRKHLDHIAALDEDAYRVRKAGVLQEIALQMNLQHNERVAAKARRDGAFLEHAYALNRIHDEQVYAKIQSTAIFENRQFDKRRLFALKAVRLANNDLIQSYKDVRNDIDLLTKGEVRHNISITATAAKLRQLSEALDRAGLKTREMSKDIDRHHDALLRMTPGLNRWRTSINKVADAVGDAFGRGSRNNFFNFTGEVSRGIVRLGSRFVDLAGYFVGLKRRVREAGSIIGGFKVVLGDLGGFLGKAAGGFLGLFGVIGPLIAILSQLAGGVLALVSSMGAAALGAVSSLAATLSFGLAGAAAAAAGALVPLAVGIGGLIFGLKNLDGQAQIAARGVKTAFKRLGVAAGQGLMFDRRTVKDEHDHVVHSFEDVMARIRGMVSDLKPIANEVGRAMADALDIFTQRIGGAQGAYTKFIKAIRGKDGSLGFLATEARVAGRVLGESFGGILGVFRALMPTIRQFLGYLRRVTIDFNDFANSARGQVEMKQFFADASQAAQDLGDFILAVGGLLRELIVQSNRQDGGGLFKSMADGLKSVTDTLDKNPDIMAGWIDSMKAFGGFLKATRSLLGELLSAGKDVGDSLFASLADQINGWVAALRQNPDILRGWYDAAGAFARALGEVVSGLAQVFAALDNTFSRSASTFVFTVIADAIQGIADVLETVSGLFGSAADAVQGFLGQAAAAAFILPKLQKGISGLALTGLITNLRGAETRMSALAGVAKTAGGVGGLLAFAAGAQQSNKFAGTLLQTLGGAATGFAFGGPWGALIGGAAGLAMGIFSKRTDDATDSVKNAAPAFADMAASLDQITGAATQATRAQVLQAAASSGVLAQARGFGISARDIVSASLGQADAQERVNAALQRGSTFTVAYRDEFGTLFTTQLRSKRQVKDFTAELAAQGLELDSVRKKATDAAGSAAITGFIGKQTNEWTSLTKKVRENYLATQDLSGLYGKLPKSVVTKLDASGIAPTISGVAKVAAKYDLLPKQVRSILQVLGVDLSVAAIRKLQAKLDETDRKRPKPTVDLLDAPALGKIKQLNDEITGLDHSSAHPKVDIDPSAAHSAIGGVRADLATLKDKTVNIYTVRHANKELLTAGGGIFSGAQTRTIGEAGPEAVVPLARNLSQVDPSVRWLSALAQGKMALGTGTGHSRTISADHWTIVTPTTDPEAVAREVFDRLAGAGY